MQRALELIRGLAPELEIDGEMHGDAALSEEIRLRVFPSTRLRGEANLFVMPTLDAANIAFNLLKTAAGGGVTIGPMLLGAARPVHILTPSATRAAAGEHDRAGGGRRQCAPRPGEGPLLVEPSTATIAPFPAGRARPRAGLVLTGGGARAAYQVGVVKAVRDILGNPVKNPFPIVCGTSAGAINAATLAVFADDFSRGVANLLEVWENMKCEHVYRTDPWHIMRAGARWLGAMMLLYRRNPVSLLDNSPLRDMLERNLDFERIQGHIDSGALYAVCVTASGYTTGQSVSFFQGGSGLEGWERNQRIGAAVSLKLDYLLASAALPFIFPGGEGASRVLRRRLDAPDRAGQPGAAPGRRPRADRRHRPPDRGRRARALEHLSVARADRRPRAEQHLPRQPVGRHRAPRAHQPHGEADPAGEARRVQRARCAPVKVLFISPVAAARAHRLALPPRAARARCASCCGPPAPSTARARTWPATCCSRNRSAAR